MPKHVDEMPEYRANLPRTGHNLSHDNAFTTTCGYLSPIFHDLLNPGETVTLGVDFLLRTQPLEAAAMSKLKVHTEYFFVPMQILYQPWDNFIYGIQENFSSKFSGDASLALPLLDLDQFGNSVALATATHLTGTDILPKNYIRYMDLLGMPVYGNCKPATSGLKIFPYQMLAYQCIYQHYYRLDNREKFEPLTFNVDKYAGSSLPAVAGSGNLPNSLFQKMFLHCRPLASDYFTDIKVSPIVDVLNLQNKNSLAVANQYLTRSNYNSDNILSSGFVGDNIDPPITSATGNPSYFIQTQFGFSSDPTQTIESGDIFPINGFDIGTANIRAMFASEKLWSVTGRARKNYDAQTLAHFGFEVPKDVKHDITCFGHDVSEIQIGEVISTSNTATESGGSPLGEIAGKGYAASGNNRHKFTAPCHGVVMAIFSIVPEEYYEPTFGKYNKLSSRDDLFTPEYDHLGMQPLFGYEAGKEIASGYSDTIMGWQYRYEQWKRRWNRASLVFKYRGTSGAVNGSLSSWIHTISPYFYLYNTEDLLPSDPSMSKPNTETNRRFFHRTNELNDLFLVKYNTNWSSSFADDPTAIYDNDPFIINSHIDCVKVSTMSDYSLPRLDA